MRKKGLLLTRRGAGNPMWPPADCVNFTQPSPTSGSAWINGYWTAGNANSRRRSLILVTPR